jgi:O-antigen/teichoic acid export membrane protein
MGEQRFMSVKVRALKNVAATWVALAVHGAVGIVLSPLILHRLGDEAFSLWILVFTVTSYFALLDFGIRSSIVKYTATFTATDNADHLSRYLSTSLAFYSVVAVLVVLLTAVGSLYLNVFFKIPSALLGSARMLFVLSGIGVGLSFPLTVFTAILEGLQKFSVLQLTQAGMHVVRAALICIALITGKGLLAIGAIAVISGVLGYVLLATITIWTMPVRLSVAHVEITALYKMAGYGVFALLIAMAEKLRFQSDAVVIGAFLSASAITGFSIAGKLVEYSGYAVRGMSQVFVPMSSHFHAVGDLNRLQRTFIAGNRACALIVFPICMTLVIMGRSIIEVWVGSRYIASYSVLVLLLVPRSLYLAQSTSTKILLGMGRHRTLASVLLLEGASNLLLSLILVRPLGLLGVALGTAIPLTCTSILFLPEHVCRLLRLPLRTFLRRCYGFPLLLCIPFTCVLWLLGRVFGIHTVGALMAQFTCGAVVYGAGLGCFLLRRWTRAAPMQAFSYLMEPE